MASVARRNLPNTYPNWQTVYYYFSSWKRSNCLSQVNQELNQLDRFRCGKEATPSLMCADSQSIKLSSFLSEERGIDAGKKVNGRKRQVLVDSDGRIWNAYVHAANKHDSIAGIQLLKKIDSWSKRLKKVLGDSAYYGQFSEAIRQNKWVFESPKKPFREKGFIPVGKRWVVERTFAWFNHFRRLSKDYEQTPNSAEAWLLWANCAGRRSAILLNRFPK